MSKIVAGMITIIMIVQGGFFPKIFLGAGILLAILLLLIKRIIIDKFSFVCFIGIVVCYYLSGVLHDVDAFSFSYVLLIGVYTIAYVVFQTILYEDTSARTHFRTGILVGVLVIGITGIFAYLGIELPGIIRNRRFMGTVQYANITACLLGIALYCMEEIEKRSMWQYIKPLLAVMLFLTLSFGGIGCYGVGLLYLIAKDKEKGWKKRFFEEIIFYGITATIATILFVGTQLEHSSILTFVSVLILVLYSIFRNSIQEWLDKGKYIYAINSCFCFLLLGSGIIAIYISGNRAIQTFQERLIHWKDGVGALRQNWLLGIGPNQWEHQVEQWQSSDYSAIILHNSYLQLGVDAGVIAMITVAMLFGYAIYKGRNILAPWQKAIGVLLLIHSSIDVHLYFSSVILIGMCMLIGGKRLTIFSNDKWIRAVVISIIFLLVSSFIVTIE